ncbi:class D beta-lactamase [Phenylobacterium montanum]|uniref:Class D beta-lactamase n=1 Tax=Phenylobacterium montanum TaxID=2823693 RepID=A0A975G3M8_9CAUL|nr:class D beta-lactamase [Caulobacter sp. S6]QUD89907.1 class D beta-lactamase [Caulobacter sp. S6]
MRRIGVVALAVLSLVTACQRKPAPAGGRPGGGGGHQGIDVNRLNSLIDSQIGGLNTCVLLIDTKSGIERYHYGDAQICMAQLPPCATFDIANALIGLDQGAVTPATVYKWDGSPQPVGLWQRDADLSQAFKLQIGWWFQRLAGAVGHDRYVERLRAFDYGSHDPAGMANAFWQGPQAGGFLTITPTQQVGFIRRFYAGQLPVRPESLAAVQALTWDETRSEAKGGKTVINDRATSCASIQDGSRRVGWWVGRVQSPADDLSFVAAIEGPGAPPGLEIERRLKDIFSQAGVLPPVSP